MSERAPIVSRARLPWLAALLVSVALPVVAVAVVYRAAQGPVPPFLAVSAASAAPPERPDGDLHVAGSGSCVPLVRGLAAAATQQGVVAPNVHASIGTGGGLRALRDGAIDLALASRPLSEGERAEGFVYIAFARIPVVVGAHLDVPDRNIDLPTLEAMFRGDIKTWKDGSRVVVLQRERGDSSHRVVGELYPAFTVANEVARSQHAFRVLFHDGAMQVALANTPGAVGLHGNGVDPWFSGFRALSVDGVRPTAQNVELGAYGFVKQLGFVTLGEPEGQVKDFIDFVLGPQGRATLRMRGAVPVEPKGREL